MITILYKKIYITCSLVNERILNLKDLFLRPVEATRVFSHGDRYID